MDVPRPRIEVLSQRELRNESGRVLRAVSEGSSFLITNRGIPVGKLIPLDVVPALPIARPARRAGGWSALGIRRRASTRSLAEIVDDLRGDRL